MKHRNLVIKQPEGEGEGEGERIREGMYIRERAHYKFGCGWNFV